MDFLSKSDLQVMYNCTSVRSLARHIGPIGMNILGWRPGKQRFTPAQIRALYDTIGKPLSREEKYN